MAAVGNVMEMHLKGVNVWGGLRKGRYDLDERALRDQLQPEFRPAAPPPKIDDEGGAAPCVQDPDEVEARRSLAREIEGLELFRELRGILDRFRDRPGCVAAFGYLLGQERLADDFEFPEFPPGGYATEDEAAAAHGETRDAVRHGKGLLRREIEPLLARLRA